MICTKRIWPLDKHQTDYLHTSLNTLLRVCSGLYALPLLVWLQLYSPASCPAQLALPETVQVATAGSAVIPLSLAAGTNVAAMQFDLEWDEAAMVISVVIADGQASAGKELYSTQPSSHPSRHLIAGLNRNMFGEGGVVQLLILVNRSAAAGSYHLKLTNVVAADPDGRSVPVNAPVTQIEVASGPIALRPDRDVVSGGARSYFLSTFESSCRDVRRFRSGSPAEAAVADDVT